MKKLMKEVVRAIGRRLVILAGLAASVGAAQLGFDPAMADEVVTGLVVALFVPQK